MTEEPIDEIKRVDASLIDILYVLFRNRWLIVLFTAISALLVLAFAMYTAVLPDDPKVNPLPDLYKPKVQIMLTWEGIQTKTSDVSEMIFTPGVLLSPTLGSPFLELMETIIYGNTVLDKLAAEFDLYRLFELEDSKEPKKKVRKRLQEVISVKPVTKSTLPTFAVIEISYISVDPEFAVGILNRLVEILEERFTEIFMNQVYEKKIFIENRMRAVEQEIERSKGALFEFTRQYGTVEISTQAQEQSKLIAQFQAEIIQNEIQIRTLGAYFKETDQRIVRLKLENEKKREIISELKTKFLGGFVPLNMAPELSARYAEIQTNLNIQNELLGRLKKEYENVKIEEVNSLNNFQILERAEVPESKYAPSRSMICIIAAILAFLVSISIAFVREYIAGIRFDEGRSEKLNQIRRFLTPWRRR